MAKISGLGKVKQNITPRLVVCAVISFLCISVDRQSNYLNPVRETLSFVVYPIQLGKTAFFYSKRPNERGNAISFSDSND